MTNIRNIKLWICVVCLTSPLASPAPPVSLKLDIIDMAAISRMTPQQLEALAEGLAAEEIMRTKRSSAQALTSVASKASSSLLQKKIGFLTQASAGSSSSLFSSSSKGSGGSSDSGGYHYEAPAPQDEKVDFLGLKKSILYTLFQAVKAITGGVTILKGQIIKGGGALAATLGKLISKKGDVVSNLGKKIVSSAALSQKPSSTAAGPIYGPPPSVHAEYGPPTAYGPPTDPAHYSNAAVSAPTGFAHKYPSQLDGWGKLNGVHAGLVILTPLEGQHDYPPVKTPLEPPSSIIGNVFSAFKDILSSKPPSMESSHSYSPTAPTDPEPTGGDHASLNYQVPPPMPYQGMTAWALNSYGEPAMAETFHDYDPRQVQPLPHAASKRLATPNPISQKTLSIEKIHKINANLEKVRQYLAENPLARSLEDAGTSFTSTKDSANLVEEEIGVLSADQLPTYDSTTTTEAPKDKTDNQKDRRKKEVKFILRGNTIVQV